MRQSPLLCGTRRGEKCYGGSPRGELTIAGEVSITVFHCVPLALSLSLCPFFRPILYFHFCQILLSRTATPLRDLVRLYFRRRIGGLLMRRALICVLAHRVRTCSSFFPLPCTACAFVARCFLSLSRSLAPLCGIPVVYTHTHTHKLCCGLTSVRCSLSLARFFLV